MIKQLFWQFMHARFSRVGGIFRYSLSTLLFILLVQTSATAQQSILLESKVKPPILLELYSSHGCSSCPPAQAWVSEFKQSALLWDEIVPMVFHVDYWDYIGWKDLFAEPLFSERQRRYRELKQLNSVYTPGFVVNGQEWTGWFQGKGLSKQEHNQSEVGKLTANLRPQSVIVDFTPKPVSALLAPDIKYINIAILGFDIHTKITRGENARKTLVDNFVVLGFKQHQYQAQETILNYPEIAVKSEKYAVVVWLSTSDELTPIQSVAGYLPDNWEL